MFRMNPYNVHSIIRQVYATLGFKDIFIVKPSSKIAYVQVRNALETVDFPGTVIDHVSKLATR